MLKFSFSDIFFVIIEQKCKYKKFSELKNYIHTFMLKFYEKIEKSSNTKKLGNHGFTLRYDFY